MSDGGIRLPHEWKPRSYQEPLWKYLSRGGRALVLLSAGKAMLEKHIAGN